VWRLGPDHLGAARHLIKEHGNSRETLDREAEKLKNTSYSRRTNYAELAL
jgi:hypothetical protein